MPLAPATMQVGTSGVVSLAMLESFKRGHLEDTDRGTSSEPSPSGISPLGATTTPKLGEINSQRGMTGRCVRLEA